MTKTIPAPILMAQQVLETLTDHPNYTDFQKKLPAFAMRYAEQNDVTVDILTDIAAQGLDALTIGKEKKADKTYKSIVKNLPEKAEKESVQAANRRMQTRDIIQERFYPQLMQHRSDFLDAWKNLDKQGMKQALENLSAELDICNPEILKIEGAYDFHTLEANRILNSSWQDENPLNTMLRAYAAAGDLEHLKLLNEVVPDIRSSRTAIPEAAEHTQLDVLDYYLKELKAEYPMIEDDYYTEDFIIQKTLEQGNLTSFKYLIDHDFSSDAYIHDKKAFANDAFFEYGLDYMQKTDNPPFTYLKHAVTRGSFEQVQKIVEGGRFQADGTIRGIERPDYYSSNNPMRYALYEAKNIDIFKYLRAQSPTDLTQDDIQHTAHMLLQGEHFDIIDFLYDAYPEDFTTEFVKGAFKSQSLHIVDILNNKKPETCRDTSVIYLIKKFGTMLDKKTLDQSVSAFFNYVDRGDLLDVALEYYPYDEQDIWDLIIENVKEEATLSNIEKVMHYQKQDMLSQEDLTKALQGSSAYQLGNIGLPTITKVIAQLNPEQHAKEWQNILHELCSYPKPLFNDVMAHLEDHPLKDDIFTVDFAKDLAINGVDECSSGEFSLIDQIVKRAGAHITKADLEIYGHSESAETQIEEYLTEREQRKKWDQVHPNAPYSLNEFSPYFHQPKAFATLAEIFEQEEELPTNTAEQYAYQTAGLFGTMPRVLEYLEKWGHQGKQPLHDVVHSLTLPKTGRFDKAAWGDAVIKHGPKMAELVRFAHRMPKPEKSSDGKTWSFHNTQARAAQFAYENSDKAPELAKLCHNLRMDEDSFEEAREIVQKFNKASQKKGKKPNQNIPKIEIQGTDFGKEGYTFKRLESGDLRGLFLGAMTDCCQWIGGVGSDCAEHGFKSPNGGFYVVTNAKDEIVSQAWAWRGRKGEIVLDSIETLGNNVSPKSWQAICNKMADHFADNHKDVTALHIGMGGQSPDLGYAETKSAKPLDKLDYSDADNQVAVWKRSKFKR